MWCGVCYLLSIVGGWQRMASTYAARREPHGTSFWWQTGSVGLVSYKGTLNIHVAQEGLFLSVPLLFRIGHRPLLVPWQAINQVEHRQFLWARSTKFQVGTPSVGSIRIPSKVYEASRAAP